MPEVKAQALTKSLIESALNKRNIPTDLIKM